MCVTWNTIRRNNIERSLLGPVISLYSQEWKTSSFYSFNEDYIGMQFYVLEFRKIGNDRLWFYCLVRVVFHVWVMYLVFDVLRLFLPTTGSSFWYTPYAQSIYRAMVFVLPAYTTNCGNFTSSIPLVFTEANFLANNLLVWVPTLHIAKHFVGLKSHGYRASTEIFFLANHLIAELKTHPHGLSLECWLYLFEFYHQQRSSQGCLIMYHL